MLVLKFVVAQPKRSARSASADALPALKQALNDTEPGVSAKAAWAISEIEG